MKITRPTPGSNREGDRRDVPFPVDSPDWSVACLGIRVPERQDHLPLSLEDERPVGNRLTDQDAFPLPGRRLTESIFKDFEAQEWWRPR